MKNSTENLETYSETRELYQERVISSVIKDAEIYLYRPKDQMPFHNVDHMHFVHKKVIEFGEYVKQHGKRPDMFALRLAALLHDCKYFDDLDMVNAEFLSRNWVKEPFTNKEDYSAWLAEPLLESYGVESKTIKKVQQLIRKTHYLQVPRTLEEKMLVRADLDNISGPRTPFIINTLVLVRESENLTGPKNPFERIAFLYGILNEYISKDLCFGDFDKDIYDKSFKKPALANIARIADHNIRGTVGHLGRRAIALLPSLDRAA